MEAENAFNIEQDLMAQHDKTLITEGECMMRHDKNHTFSSFDGENDDGADNQSLVNESEEDKEVRREDSFIEVVDSSGFHVAQVKVAGDRVRNPTTVPILDDSDDI